MFLLYFYYFFLFARSVCRRKTREKESLRLQMGKLQVCFHYPRIIYKYVVKHTVTQFLLYDTYWLLYCTLSLTKTDPRAVTKPLLMCKHWPVVTCVRVLIS